MKAAFLTSPRVIEIRETPDPKIVKENQVKVKVRSVGVCGSDAHFYMDGRLAGWVVKEPLILGHECSGDVVEVGKGVKKIRVGDRVAVEPGIPCRQCEWCKRGEYHLCPDMVFYAVPGVHGAFADYVISEEDFLFLLPDNLSYEEGALMEPLAVAVEAMKLGNLQLGDSVAILGAGTIGLLCTQAALAGGATDIYVSDINPMKLEFVKQYSKNRITTIDASQTDTLGEVMNLTKNRGVDKAFETAGTFETFHLAPMVTRRGGRVTLVGIPPFKEYPYRASDLFDRTVTINAVYRYANDYPIALRLAAKGLVNLLSIVSHRFSLDEIHKGLEITATRSDNVIKAVMNR
ncbi:MAG: NAD(P)-dependent alcohol dehydrogenase [Candidatus Atribacteria bacterium]|nr:NAD(P)-dependent alcohol dehydrogenase [Candidatus Atribacteria bacterium]